MGSNFFCVVILSVFVAKALSVAGIAKPTERGKLFNDLMKNYNPKLLPTRTNDSTILIHVEFTLLSVVEFNDLHQFISTSGYFTLTWTDELLTWNHSDYGGEEKLVLTQKDIWLPDVAIFNFHNGLQDISPSFVRTEVFSSGEVRWFPGGVYQTTCPVNMKYFPFDTQICEVTIGSWTYGLPSLDWKNNSSGVNVYSFNTNGVWDLIDTSCQKIKIQNANVITFKLVLERKPETFILDTILPIALLSILNVVVFKVPVESGERLSYSITVLLSFAVFMTVITNAMPKDGDSMSILTMYVAIMISISAGIVLLTALTLNLYHSDRKVPSWLCMRIVRSRNDDRKVSPEGHVTELSWKQVTSRFDALFFWFLLTVAVVLTFVCMLVIGYQL